MKFEVRQVNECPLCNNVNYNFLYFNNGGGRDDPQGILDFQVEVVKCSHCGLVYSKSVLTEDSIVEFFSNYASSEYSGAAEPLFRKSGNRLSGIGNRRIA